jgi:hypothetical protein
VVVDLREGGAVGGGVLGVVEKSLHAPPGPEAASYQHRRRQAHRPRLNTRLFTPSAEEKNV